MEYTDKDYNIIDDKAYSVSGHKFKTYDLKNNKGVTYNLGTNKQWVIIDQSRNDTNRFKAYAVAPIKGKKPDYNNVVVSFAGTDGAGSINDVLTDIETIGLRSNKYVEPKVNQNILNLAKLTSIPALAALSVSFQDADGQYHKSIVGEDELNVFVGWQITRAKLITRWDDNE